MSLALPPVLVVDDEKNMRATLQTLLGDEGYPVKAVERAEEGLDLVLRESFLMVITDVNLGGLNGYDFLKRLRKDRPDLPVLLITAYDTTKGAVEALKAGAMDYLPKPLHPEELLHAVGQCAERGDHHRGKARDENHQKTPGIEILAATLT